MSFKCEFRKCDKIFPRDLSTDYFLKFWTFILKIKIRRDCPVFHYSGVFSEFLRLRAISSELLKVNRIDFRSCEKMLPKKLSKSVMFKFLVNYFEN